MRKQLRLTKEAADKVIREVRYFCNIIGVCTVCKPFEACGCVYAVCVARRLTEEAADKVIRAVRASRGN